MVASLQRPVPQGLIDRQHGRALGQHPAAGHQHLPVARGLRRRPRPAAGDGGVRALCALAPLDHVPVVRGKDNHPASMAGPVQQRQQMLDGIGVPLGAAGVGTVERVVDGVQHAGDEGPAGHVADSRRDVIGDGVSGPGRVQRLLVEQRRALQAMRASQFPEPGQLDVLAAGAKLTAEQRGAADLRQGGQHGQRGGPPGLPVQQCLGPAVRRARQNAGDDLGRRPGAHSVQDQQQDGGAASQRNDDPGQQVLQAPHAALVAPASRPGRRWCTGPARARTPDRGRYAGPGRRQEPRPARPRDPDR